MRTVRCLFVSFSLFVSLAGCFGEGDGDPSAPKQWPPEFREFSFARDRVVLFPGTCELVTFTLHTVPAYGLDDVDITVVNGPTRIEELEREEGEVRSSLRYRACTREAHSGEHDEGSIRVTFKERPDYYVEAKIVRRASLRALSETPPALVLPVGAIRPVDVAIAEDEASVEVATVDGTVAKWSLETLTIHSERFGELDTRTLVDERRVIGVEPFYGRAHFIDTQTRALLNTWAIRSMAHWENPGVIQLAHANGGTLAFGGHERDGQCFVSALDGRGGFFASIMVGEMIGNYGELRRDEHLEHLVVSPDGRTVASRIVGCRVNEGEMGLHDVIAARGCSFASTGSIGPYLFASPAFSNDSAWFLDQGLNVYSTLACSRRAAGVYIPSLTERAELALSSGGHVAALGRATEIRIYDVPPEFGTSIVYRGALAAFHGAMLRFSADGTKLFAARGDEVRIYDLLEGTYVASPRLVGDEASLYGVHLHVPVEDTSEGGDLIYALGTRSTLAARLPARSDFHGIDASARAVYGLDEECFALDLHSGDASSLGAPPCEVVPADPSSAYSLFKGDDAIVVERN